MNRRAIANCAALLMGLTSLTGCLSDGGGQAACAPTFDFNGTSYSPSADDGNLKKQEIAGRGGYPECGDTGDVDVPSPTSKTTDVWQLKGIDPEDGVGVIEGDELVLYVSDETGAPCDVPHTAC